MQSLCPFHIYEVMIGEIHQFHEVPKIFLCRFILLANILSPLAKPGCTDMTLTRSDFMEELLGPTERIIGGVSGLNRVCTNDDT